jgi:hypothetical protein
MFLKIRGMGAVLESSSCGNGSRAQQCSSRITKANTTSRSSTRFFPSQLYRHFTQVEREGIVKDHQLCGQDGYPCVLRWAVLARVRRIVPCVQYCHSHIYCSDADHRTPLIFKYISAINLQRQLVFFTLRVPDPTGRLGGMLE